MIHSCQCFKDIERTTVMTVQIVNKTKVLELHIYHNVVFSINFRFKEFYTKVHYLEVLQLIKKDERE